MIKSCAVAGAVAVAVVLSAPVAGAVEDLDCADIGRPVNVLEGDPNNLDADGDGVGCESQPGAAVDQDEALADTGAGDVIQRHPLRAYGAAGLLVLGGAATVIVVRRRAHSEES